jgi:hypothetical protein
MLRVGAGRGKIARHPLCLYKKMKKKATLGALFLH